LRYKIFKGGIFAAQTGALLLKGVRSAAMVGTAGGGLAIAGSAILGPVAWTFVGLVYVAETGINYRRMKRGEISKDEFKKRVK